MRIKNIVVLLLFGFSVPIDLSSKIKAVSKPRVVAKSKTSVKAKNSTVVNKSPTLSVGQLQIQVNQNASLEGLPVNFELGGYSTNNGSQTSFTGSYVPATGTAIVNSSSCQSLPGTVNFPMQVSGNASLEGVGNMPNGLSLAGPSTNLTINAANSVNSSINLNGGTSSIQSDLNFGSDSQFQGAGDIEGNGNSVILGGKDLTITSTLNWINADVVANSRLTLWGTWNFTGDVHVLGRGNVLDLSHGGDLVIKHNTRVYIANLNIRGLGSGTIQFQDDTGELVLASCTIELDNNYNFNKGGIYIDGPTTIITRDNILSFDTNASMTVDGVTLWYDPLTFDDNNNIRPTPVQDPNEKFIAYFNNGIIRPVVSAGGDGGDKHYITDVLLEDFTVYSPNARAFFDASLLYDGGDNVAYFATSGTPISFVAAATRTVFTNVRLQNYAPSFMTLYSGASVIFEDGTIIDLGISDELTSTWTFRGNCTLRGDGQTLTLGAGGGILVQGAGSTLSLDGINIAGITGNNVCCTDKTNTIYLKNVTWSLDSDYTFSTGGIYVSGPTTIITKDNILTFDTNASLTVDGVTLWYDTLIFDDNTNIRPTPVQDPNEKFIAYFNAGVIKQVGSGGGGDGGDKHYTSDVLLEDFTVYSPNARAFFDASLSYDGNNNVAYFATSGAPISFIAAATRTVFSNVRLQNYAPSFMTLDPGASIIFDDGTVIELGISDELNMTWTFRGNCVLQGGGQTLTLGTYGAILVQGAASSLTLDNIKIAGVNGINIRCTDDTTTIALQNASWSLDSDYSFTKGRFDVFNRFEINGASKFSYQTAGQSSIAANSTMLIDFDSVFDYSPPTNNRDLIVMDDVSSILYLNGAALSSSTTGLRLTVGTVIVDKLNYIDNPGAVSVSEGIEFGDGTLGGDLNVNIVPGGAIDVLSGCFNIN